MALHKTRMALLLGLVASLPATAAAPAQLPPDYSSWPNGPWQDADFFPIAVWWQTANETGHSGPFPTLAAAAAASDINIFLGQGADWPERFGADNGEIETIKQNGLYLVGGTTVPWQENTSAHSVASILALAGATGTRSNLIGYNAGDEPQCQSGGSQIYMPNVPSIIQGINSYDPTRIVTLNETDWMIEAQWQTQPPSCLTWDQSALQATSIGSFDYYPLTNPYIATQLGVTGSDFQSVGNDSLWVQGPSVRAMRYFARPGQPLWAYIESGSDNFGFSSAANTFPAGVTKGSTILVNASGRSEFTSTWVGLTISGGGIPPGARIVGVTDPTRAVMSATATATAASESVSVTGGVNNSDCVASVNLCVVNGNEYRPTPAQVNAEVWMSIINGANGLEYFCHDSLTYSFCLGDSAAAGSAATIAQQNITYINTEISTRAPVLNARTVGMCSMQHLNYVTGAATMTSSCTDQILTMTTHDPAVPGMALVKSYEGATFLFAQSDRRGPAGARFSFALDGLAGQTATVVYDSNQHYNRPHSSYGATFRLDSSGQFSDILGADHDDYQVKIYSID